MATVYVSKSGAAGRSGERSDPLVSLAAAITSLNSSGSGPHELIIMDDGVYSEANLGNSPVLARDDITIMAETGSSGLPVVSPSIRGSGSAAAAQNFAIYCDNNWLIKGITFRDFVIAANNGVIKPRSLSADEGGIKVELCTFHNITGSCIYLDVGSDGTDPGIHTIDGNTFYNINTGGSGSAGSIIQLTNTKDLKMKVVNNVFYDWQPRGTADNIIHIGNASNTQRPLCVISHNTFGTSSAETGAGSVVIPTYAVEANLAKFEYNIIKDQTTVTSFADIASGEANYNIYHNVTSTSPGTNAPFGDSTAPTGALNNRNIDPLLTGPFVDSTANYRLSGVASPAFDAAIGSSDATRDNKMSVNYYKMTKDFLLHEGNIPEANILTYVQALSEVIANMKPRTQVEGRRLATAKQQLKEIKKMARKMQEQINVLEERVNVLEEIKEDLDNGKVNS
jgi:hypothetical protein